jgi:DNA-binding CsgD family transcriptional regulator
MSRTHDGQLRRFSKALLALYAEELPSATNESVLNCLKELVDADIVAYTEWDHDGQVCAMQSSPTAVALGEFLQTFGRFEHEHPCLTHIKRSNDPSALRISDFIGLAEFRDRGLYHEFFRHYGITRSLGMCGTHTNGMRYAVGFNRGGSDFQSADKDLLEALRPHLALRLKRRYSERPEAKDPGGPKISERCRVDPDGRMIDATQPFESILRRYYPDSGSGRSLSGELRSCQKVSQSSAKKSGASLPSARHLGKANGSGHLVVFLEPISAGGGVWLKLNETCRSPSSEDRDTPAKRGVTRREAEILRWVREGKTNWEISRILDIAERTVAKHLENAFQTLGVGTRTAAVRAMSEELLPRDGS